jgi:spermidine synthase
MPRVRTSPALLLLFLSGGAALGYQMAWSRLLAAGLGHEMPAMLAVVAAFMGGMALGAWALDRRIRASPNPARWYAALELVIGLWALASPALLAATNELAWKAVGFDPSPLRHWLVAFVFPAVALLPAAAAMGATFPAMERLLTALNGGARGIGALYAANTFGAVAGILGGTFLLAPRFGLGRTVQILAVVNLLCAAGAFLLPRVRAPGSTADGSSPSDQPAARPPAAVLFITGLLGIGFEVAGTRVLAQVLENTIYSFAAVLSVYLLGTAAGAALYQRFAVRCDPRALPGNLLAATALACAGGLLALGHAKSIHAAARGLGDAPGAGVLAEMLVAAAVFALPAMGMGATFSHLVELARARGGVGRAVALNTLGGALAPALFGVGLLPWLGSKWTLATVACGYAVLVFTRGAVAPASRLFVRGVKSSRGFRATAFLLAGTVVLLLLALPAQLHIVTVPPGGKTAAFREGVMAAVAVIEGADGHRTLRVNNRFQMGGTAAADAERRGAHIPLLLHPAPRRALFLGLGTGITLGGALDHPGVQAEGVELVPEVLEFMPLFAPANGSPQLQANVLLHAADARRFVRATTNRHDVIVADLFHPARDGAGALYTVEHFRAVRACLATNGLFCQWLPLHQLDDAMLRVVVRTFLEVFPDGSAWLLRHNVDAPVMGLMGGTGAPALRRDAVESRLGHPALAAALKKLALADSTRLAGHFVMGAKALRELAGAAPLNTDDNPQVTFGAPRLAYRTDAAADETLLRLLEFAATRRDWSAVWSGDAAKAEAFCRARDVFLHGLSRDARGDGDAALAACIESARLSEDFTAGYAQCLTAASLLAKSDPAKARRILEQLIEAQPSRPVARELLRRME